MEVEAFSSSSAAQAVMELPTSTESEGGYIDLLVWHSGYAGSNVEYTHLLSGLVVHWR